MVNNKVCMKIKIQQKKKIKLYIFIKNLYQPNNKVLSEIKKKKKKIKNSLEK